MQKGWRRIYIAVFRLLIMCVGAFSVLSSPKDFFKYIRAQGLIAGVTQGMDSNIVGKNSWINLYGLAERLAGKKYIKDADITYDVIKDNNDQLQFITFPKDLSGQVEKVTTFYDYLEAEEIPCIYVQTPLKIIEGFTEIPSAVVDYGTANTDKFLEAISEVGVQTLDLREKVIEEELDLASLFFDTDHHWRTETAFWAVGQFVDYLKEAEGIDLDADGFYTDVNNYEATTYSQNFLGSQGRRVGKYFAGVDDYTLLVPDFETDYTVTIVKSDGSNIKEGDFRESIIFESLLEEEDVFTNRYAAYFGADYPEVIIENHLAPVDQKILLIKDSFALPFSAFLSTMVSEVRMLDLRYNQSMTLEEYVAANDIDVVVYLYKSMNAS